MFWELLEQDKFSASAFSFLWQKEKQFTMFTHLGGEPYMVAKGSGVKRGYVTVTECHQ